MKLYLSLALTGAMALLSVPAEAQQVIKAANGQCVGVSEVDGISLFLTDCFNRGTRIGLTVDSYAYQGPIRVTTSDRRSLCLDAWRGAGGQVEVLNCDGTPEQNWDLSTTFTNAGMSTCITAVRGGGVMNAGCNSSRRQQFSLSNLTTADLASNPSGSFGSGVSPTSPALGSMTGGGGSLIGNDAGSLVGQDGASLIGNDAGSLVGQDGAAVVGHNGGALVGQDGASLIGNDAGSLVGQDGASLLGNNSNNLVGQDGASLVGMDGATLLGNNSNNFSLLSADAVFQVRVGDYCLDASGQVLVVQDCQSASWFHIFDGLLKIVGQERCVDGVRGQYKLGYEEDQGVRESVRVYDCDGSSEQLWGALDIQDSGFLLANQRFGLCMDIDYGVIQPGRSVLLWKCYTAQRLPHQVFSAALAAPPAASPAPVADAPAVVAAVIGECRDPWVTQAIREVTGSAPTGSGESGDCYIGNYNGGSWGGYEELVGYVRAALVPGFKIAIGSYCLDASGSTATIEDCSRGSMFDLSSGQLRVVGANTCVDAYRGAHKVGYEEDQSVREPANVLGCDGSQEQNWTFHETSGNAFFIKDDRFGLCMDVDGGVIAPGRSVLLWKCYDAVRPANQIFSLVY